MVSCAGAPGVAMKNLITRKTYAAFLKKRFEHIYRESAVIRTNAEIEELRWRI